MTRTPKSVASDSAQKPPIRRRKQPQPGLSREHIVAESLAQIDELGLDSFSLRTIAKRLNVYPTAIYWYVDSRNHLLADVVALALGTIPSQIEGQDWRDYLRLVFNAYRGAIRAHPHIAPLIASQLLSNTSVDFAFVENILGALSGAGFAGQSLVGAYNAIIASIVGFTTQEFAPVPTEDTDQWRDEMRLRLETVDETKFPVLAANVDLLANRAFILRWENGTQSPLNDSFVLFVDALIAGLGAYERPR